MKIPQAVVLTKEELMQILDGKVYAFINPGDNQEIFIMNDETYEEWTGD